MATPECGEGLACALGRCVVPSTETRGSLRKPRVVATATLLPSGEVLLAGGMSSEGLTASAEIFEPITRTTRDTGSMSTARWLHVAAQLPDGRVLVAGGKDADDAFLSSAEIYDPTLGTWTSVAPLSAARSDFSIATLPGGDLLAIGGASTPGSPDPSAERYRLATDSWSFQSVQGEHAAAPAVSLPDGTVVAFGGSAEWVDAYDPVADSWTPLPPLIHNRYNHTGTLLSDGDVLLAGGREFAGAVNLGTSTLVERWRAGSFIPAQPLPEPREDQSAVRLADGRVALVGGFRSFTPTASETLRSISIYDPAGDIWTVGPSMVDARNNCTATLLADGNILVAGGGVGTTFIPVGTFEILTP